MQGDCRLLSFYQNQLAERERLRHREGQLELARTKELLDRFLPRSPATVIDIGGGTGVYAFWLASHGYESHQADVVPVHVEEASRARHYRMIRYDRRGYGRSDRPAERYSPVADALAVLDHLRVDRAVLLGASAGGGSAIEIALAHPDRVSALVLVGAVVRGHPFSAHFQQRGQKNMAPLAQADYRAAMRNWVEDPYLLAPGKEEAREALLTLLAPYAPKHLTNPFELAEVPEQPPAERCPRSACPL